MENYAEFIPGELPIYEKYNFENKRTLFGLMKLWYFFIKALLFYKKWFGDGDSDDDSDGDGVASPKDCWQKTTTIVQFHKDRIFLNTQKRFLIIQWFKKYGKRNDEIRIKDIDSVSKEGDQLVLGIGGRRTAIPIGKGTTPENVAGFVRDLLIAKPGISTNVTIP